MDKFDLTRAAQARRRQRVQTTQRTNASSEEGIAQYPREQQLQHRSASSVMDQSMEVGEDAAALLASLRKKQQQVDDTRSSKPTLSKVTKPIPASSTSPEEGAAESSGDTPTFSYFRSMLSQTHNAVATPASIHPHLSTTSKPVTKPRVAFADAQSTTTGPSATSSSATTFQINISNHSNKTTKADEVPNQETIDIAPLSIAFQLLSSTTNDTHSLLDASCVYPSMPVMLQSHAVPTRTLSIAADVATATLQGHFLGARDEVLHLHRIRGAHHNPTATANATAPVLPLAFGDTVSVQWSHQSSDGTPRFLTVLPKSQHVQASPQQTTSALIKSQHWTLCTISPQQPSVKVGRAAMEEEALLRSGSTHAPRRPSRQIIRFGDAVVLRNAATGGILTISADPNAPMRVLTDAHAQPHIRAPEESNDDDDPTMPLIMERKETSLMTRLQQSDQLVPSAQELFSFRPASSPPVPLWIRNGSVPQSTGSSATTCCYMDASYLWYADRFTDMQELAQRSLVEGIIWNKSDNYSDPAVSPPQSPVSLDQQERILLNELLAACIGLEGHYIKAVASGNDNDTSMWDSLRFHLNDTKNLRFDTVVRRRVEDLLALPTLFVQLRRFVYQRTPGYEYGSVLQAFCERLGEFLHEHMGLVVTWVQSFLNGQLVHLSQFQVESQPALHSLSILAKMCRAVETHKGGALINALRRWKIDQSGGDAAAVRIVLALLEEAAVPFLERLSDWLRRGRLTEDPQGEFMIQRNNGNSKLSWEHQYRLEDQHVPEGYFATPQVVERALAAGRYWNAVRSCDSSRGDEPNVDGETADMEPLHYSSSVAVVSSYVQTKYLQASRSLVRLLLQDYQLLGALRSMKRFFLMEYGDFFVHFLDCAEDELLKDVTTISRPRVQHWMDSSRHVLDHRGDEDSILTQLCGRFSLEGLTDHLDKLHASSGGIDTQEAWTPMRHTYGGTLGSTTAQSDVTGLDTFYLEWAEIPFPISIVLSTNVMECYQLLFRHLFFAKYVERRLVSIWKDHQMMKELQSLRGPMGATFLLRQRMLHLLQNLIYYMMFEVIEPHWLVLETKVGAPDSSKEQTVDDILHDHNQFLHRVLEACLLTNRDLVRALTKLLKTCLLFSEQMKRFMKATKIEEERNIVATNMQREVQHHLNSRVSNSSTKASAKQLRETLQRRQQERRERVQRQSARVEREVSGEAYRRMVTRFDEVFTKHLREFMIQLTRSDDIFHTHKVNLCIRLDYNGFITRSLGLI
jgi:gamma-tubulin complex component 2